MITTTDTNTTPLLTRRLTRHSHRSVAFVERDGRLAGETTLDATARFDSPAGLTALLASVARLEPRERPRVIYLTEPAPTTDWWREPLRAGWLMRQWHNARDRRTAVYARDDVTLDVRLSAPWFGAETSAPRCFYAWRRLHRSLQAGFGEQVELLATPAATGLELFEAALPFGASIPTLPDDLREQIAAISTQGRRELLPPPRLRSARTLPDLWQLDGRWMYAACVHALPVGPAQRDHRNEFAGYTPGFYHVYASIPRDWRHIGLLPCRDEGTGRISYPRAAGQHFWSWATGAEVALAFAQGWSLLIEERILWPQTGRMGQPDVAKTWIAKLKAIREQFQTAGDPASLLAADAVRHLVVDTIGRWASRDHEEHGLTPLARIAEMPVGAIPHVEAETVLWTRTLPMAPDLLRYAHPEWAAMVWGRCRARLASRALEEPFAALVALRTDALWLGLTLYELAQRQMVPGQRSAGDTRPGAWRIKSGVPGPLTWPTDEAAFLTLLRNAAQEED